MNTYFTQIDHAFRSKVITGFTKWRSAVSADVDHPGRDADEGLVGWGVGELPLSTLHPGPHGDGQDPARLRPGEQRLSTGAQRPVHPRAAAPRGRPGAGARRRELCQADATLA
jgi:hypothetical protein